MTTGAPGVDLLLGSDLGLWALETVATKDVARVLTLDEAIAAFAQERGHPVSKGDANEAGYAPSRVGFSVHYPRILKLELLARYRTVYNLHPGYLPWGRGYYPIFWALWEETPAGATLHEIDAGIDAGPIVAQARVEYDERDTGGSLFRRVRDAERRLFLEYWPRIARGDSPPAMPQPPGGSYHSKREFAELKRRAEDASLGPEQRERLLRCLTFRDDG